jgi:hypothetical protein
VNYARSLTVVSPMFLDVAGNGQDLLGTRRRSGRGEARLGVTGWKPRALTVVQERRTP